MKHGISVLLTRFLIVALIITISACGKKDAAPPPLAEVSVVTIIPESLNITTELPGRISSVRTAEVRARATGILLKRLFQEGADVKEGDILFEIDPQPLKAALANARAELAKNQATLNQNQSRAQRLKELVKIDAVSKEAFETAVAVLDQNKAEVQAAQAALDTATINLGYANVTAPISGRIGKAMVTEGALVSASEATMLAVITQLDPVYFDFTQSSTEVLSLKRAIAEGKLSRLPNGEARVTLTLEDGSAYDQPGHLLFSDVSVDAGTGMILLRASFPNPDRTLLAGMFARGRLEQAVNAQAITVPQRTVTRNQDGSASVMVVNAEDRIEKRIIKTSSSSGSRWVVSEGLAAGDRVVVEGTQKAPPGAQVKTVPFIAAPESGAPALVQQASR